MYRQIRGPTGSVDIVGANMKWRFDQGRLDYFRFDAVRLIATGLSQIDGVKKPSLENDHLRDALAQACDLPFAPANYTVWRNYKRVFGCLMLAAEVNGHIYASDLCKDLADPSKDVSADDFVAHFARSFYYPSPVFDGYRVEGPLCYPVIAILKLLVLRLLQGVDPSVSPDEVAHLLAANNVSGFENPEDYAPLKPGEYAQDVRQIRELMIFVSQHSVLKWSGEQSLALEPMSAPEAIQLLNDLAPRAPARLADRGSEVLSLGSGMVSGMPFTLPPELTQDSDREFAEGGRIRVTHLRVERSSRLKQAYFASANEPAVCKMCGLDTSVRYPWAEKTIEVHHLLPLGSPLRVDAAGTSLKDVVGLCPSCHRAIHKFYSVWLKSKSQKDFASPEEAHAVFEEAKALIVV